MRISSYKQILDNTMRGLKTGFVLFISLWFAACSKEEGKGGLASITGVVMVQNVNYHSGQLFGSLQPAQDERVFILYGNNTTAIGNDTRTSFDGSFEFPFLVQGNYSVFALSSDITNVNGPSIEVKKEISLNSKKAKIETDTIILYRFVKFDKGSSSIRGKVARIHGGVWFPDESSSGHIQWGYAEDNDTTSVVEDAEVFLVMVGSPAILERARTDAHGEYEFSNLIPATYGVYTIGDKTKNVYDIRDAVGDTVKITKDNQHILLPAFLVSKEK